VKGALFGGAAAAAAGAGVALYGGQVPTAQIFGPTVYRVRGATGRLALSYDDGPNPKWTPKLMELLDRYDAKATFFLIGRWAGLEPGLIRELVAAGHAIGNHTHTHPTIPLLRAGELREELKKCRGAVEDAGETFSTIDGAALFRPPYGRRRPGSLRTLREDGYVPVTWSVTCYDWREKESGEQFGHRAMKAKDGDIILLHDGFDREPAYDRSRSLEATRMALEHHTARGARFVTVPDLVGGAPPDENPAHP
jgi:peptidoglycan/xylan/chitin deacetylase (PgdA/CDA1 family)